jgi:hypothetical protein
MTKIIQYVSLPAGRDKVMKELGLFTVLGATIVSAILLAATFLH